MEREEASKQSKCGGGKNTHPWRMTWGSNQRRESSDADRVYFHVGSNVSFELIFVVWV